LFPKFSGQNAFCRTDLTSHDHRNLRALFEPKSIALIGASNRPHSVGAVTAKNLFEAGFAGPIMTVNPREQAIRSTINYHSVEELPLAPDLAVIATPPLTVPGIISSLGARGTRAVIVVTAGFGEGGSSEGAELRRTTLEAAKPHLVRILGPNCLGFISPARGINASFAHLTPLGGGLAFISQSGALVTAAIDWATARGFGFSHVISIGDMIDVDFGDLLDYLALDQLTHAILLYVESIVDAQKFISAGRIAARNKPVLVLKSGRSSAGAKAAMSHTGALAGADLVYDAAFRRAGMLRVKELSELFEAVSTLSAGIKVKGDRLTVVTNGGGVGVLAADALEDQDGRLTTLSTETLARLDSVLPRTWSRGNPIDILGDASPERYRGAVKAILAEPEMDAILIMNCPTAVADSLGAATEVVESRPADRSVPVLTAWLGETAALPARRLFAANKIPTYETPDDAITAFMYLSAYSRNQELLLETPLAHPGTDLPDREAARKLIAEVLANGRSLLTEPEAKSVLEAYAIPIVDTRTARDPAEAARIAAEIGGRVAIKILSPDIVHKSDVGGVRLDLSGAEVESVAREMLDKVGRGAPQARLTGFSVEEMIARPQAFELLAGIADDPVFGPVILFGQGGTAAEIIRDRALGLPPLNLPLAREMIGRTRVARLLEGYRDRPAAAVDEIALTLVKLSQLLVDVPEITELDINPLIADSQGVLALDARIVVRSSAAAVRLAIRPYPSEFEATIALADGTPVFVRPIRPEDQPKLVAMVMESAPRDVYLRFFHPMKQFPRLMAARFSQIDYSREMAFVAISPPGSADAGDILGIARMIADPDNERAEFAVMVRSDWHGRTLGFRLMQTLITCADRRGIGTLYGDVLRENTTMLQMARELGFKVGTTDAPECFRVERSRVGQIQHS
jgi:acetyltransferase